MLLRVAKSEEPKGEEFSLPASKSISNRLLMIRFLAGSSLKIGNLSSANDTVLLFRHLDSLQRLCANPNTKNENGETHIPSAEFDCEDAGTTLRFLVCLLATTYGSWEVKMSRRLASRPHKPLIDALKALGADIESKSQNDAYSLVINGRRLQGGKRLSLCANLSSQFVSALALVARCIDGGLELEISPAQVSMPYIRMTVELMRNNGAKVEMSDTLLKIAQSGYSFQSTECESDWSAAAFGYALMVSCKLDRLQMNGLKSDSLQGDSIVADWFDEFFGVKTKYNAQGALLLQGNGFPAANKTVTLDFKQHPDLFIPMLMAAVAGRRSVVFTSLDTLIYKECDRLHEAVKELGNLGLKANIQANELRIYPCDYASWTPAKGVCISACSDHRMAMGFGVLACAIEGGFSISGCEAVAKSFPDFWKELSKFCKIVD